LKDVAFLCIHSVTEIRGMWYQNGINIMCPLTERRYIAMDSNKEKEPGSIPAIAICRKCGAALPTSAKFCSNCGAKQNRGEAWYYQPIWIIVLALFVLGPFALVLVWKSPKMGVTVKIVMAVAILIYTFYCGVLTYKVFMIEIRQFNEINAILNDIINR